MGRGFLTGAVLGALVSVAIIAAISQRAGFVELTAPAPQAAAVELPPGSEFNRERPDLAPVLPGPEAPPAADAAPSVTAPTAEVPPVADPAPAGTPQTATVGDALDGPEAPSGGIAAPETEQAVLATPDIVQPRQPAADDQPDALSPLQTPAAADTAPEDVALPEPDDTGPGAAPAGEQGIAALPQPGPAADAPAQDAGPGVPDAPAGAPAAGIGTGGIAAPEVAETGPGTAPGQEQVAVVLPEPRPVVDAPAPGAGPQAPMTPAEAPDAGLQAGEIAVPETGGAPGAPAPAAVEAPEAPRLPGSEIAAPGPEAGADAPPAPGTAPEAPAPAGPAIEIYARPAPEVPDGVPILSVILVDPGPGRPEPFTLKDFPVPLTVAVDPTLPDAAQVMADYRAAGVEVAVLTPLPARATPADVEVAFQSFLAAVPQAVAVMDLPEARLQENRPRAAQVAAILAETGHGLVTYERGLNSGIQVAERAGVPAATVELRIDGSGRDVAAIRRFLDQGAFRAGQSGRAILTGEVRPETLQALAEWVLGTRAATVGLVPVSAALTR